MSVHIGWWAIPTLITLASFAWAFWPKREDSYGYDIVGMIQLFLACILSLVAWLIWALIA